MSSIRESSTSSTPKPEPSSFVEKIQVLVGDEQTTSSSPNAFEQERCLVAWVLLTRLSQEELDQAWAKFGLCLIKFAESILVLQKRQDACYELYMRLIAQVTTRLGNNYPAELGAAMFHAWKDNDSSSPELNIDICNTFDTFIQEHPEKAKELKVLGTIWEAYSSDELQTTKNGVSTPAGAGDDWDLMAQTLEGILQNADTDYYSRAAWDETVMVMFQSHGTEFLPEPVIPSVLTWISKSSKVKTLPISLRSVWFEWIMVLIQARISLQNDPSSFQFTLHRNGVPEQVNHFLLANIVSPVSDTDFHSGSLRALAWQTVIGIVDECGWGWMFPTTSSVSSYDGKLGCGTTLCTWIRLTSGEWRIQLQAETSNSSSTGIHATTLPVGNACARMLMNVVDFCVELHEKSRMNLSPDAIVHLRQSLEDSLVTTVEYLNTRREHKSDGLFSAVAIRLLGSLLRETDIWSLLEKDQWTSQTVIECLKNLLGKGTDYSLLPGLVNVLAAADSDPVKQSQIACLGDPLLDYLEGFWQSHNEDNLAQWLLELDDTVAWACSCTEFWADGDVQTCNNTIPNKRRLQLSVVEFIQNVLPMSLPMARLQSYLSLAVGCYMTLSKEHQRPPTDHESQIIFRALQICETA